MHATSDSVLRLDDLCVDAVILQVQRGRETRQPSTDYDGLGAMNLGHCVSAPQSAGFGSPGLPERQQFGAQ